MTATTQTPGRGSTYLYLFAAMVIAVAGLRAARDIVQPFLLAVFVSVVAVPVYAWLVKRRVAEWLALLIVISGVIGATLAVFFFVMTSLVDFTRKQDHYIDQLHLKTRPLRVMLTRLIPTDAAAEADVPADPETVPIHSPNGTSDQGDPPAADPVETPESASAESANALRDSAAEATSDDASGNSDSASDHPGAVTKDDPSAAQVADEDSTAAGKEVADAAQQTDPEQESNDLVNSMIDGPPLQPKGPRPDWQQLILRQFDPGTAISLAAVLLGSVGDLLSNLLLILLTIVFILLEASTFPQKLIQAFGREHGTLQRYEHIIANVRRYIAMKTWISLLTGVLIAGWLAIFQVPHAALWGLLAFLLNFIPNIGSIIAAVPALLIAWLDVGLLPCAACAVGYVVVNVGIGNFLEPRVIRRGMGLSALVVFCSMVFWGWVLGPVGMLLSVPLTMGVRVALEGFEDTRWLGTLLGNSD
ncbi:MAG: AI-2E family transporter [Planctomycetaceae bacterium]|nr:AI-2E family transporter [Planctomycetaceae bacterium]